MLRYNRTLELAVAQIMAQTLNHKQLSIACMGTPLHEMASACMGMGTDLGTLGEDRISGASVVINNIVGASVDHDIQVLHSEPKEDYTEVYSISAHTARYASYAGKVAENVKRTLMLAEQASGKIKAVFDDVNVLFSSNDRVIPINIVPMVGNGDLSNEADLIKYAETLLPKGYETVREAKTPCAYPEIPNIEELPIAEIIKTGVGSLDTQLKEWAVKGGASLIHKVYQYCFNSSTETVDPTGYVHFDSNMLEHFDPQATALDVAVALMLLAKNIDDVELEYSGNRLSLDEIKLGLTVTRQFAASNMIYQLERVQNGRKSGKVVYSYPKIASSGDDWSKTVYEIIVDKITYDQFLDEGGTPEIIFGSYVSQHAYLKDDLLAGSENFIKAWADGEQTLRHERTQSEIARLFRVIRERIYRDYNELTQEERASIDTGMVADELAIFNKHLTARGLNHLYDIIREVYCSIFYAGTEVQCLLRCIDEVNVPDGASKETVLRIAIVEYVSKWMMEQTEMVDFVDDPTGRGAGLNAFYSRMKDADEEDLLAGLNELMAEQEKQERLLDRIENIRESGLISAGDIRYIRSVQPGLLSDLPAGTIFSAEPSTQGYEAGLNAITAKTGIIAGIIAAIIGIIGWIISKIFGKKDPATDVMADPKDVAAVEEGKKEDESLVEEIVAAITNDHHPKPTASDPKPAKPEAPEKPVEAEVVPPEQVIEIAKQPSLIEVVEGEINKIKIASSNRVDGKLPREVLTHYNRSINRLMSVVNKIHAKNDKISLNMDVVKKLSVGTMCQIDSENLIVLKSPNYSAAGKLDITQVYFATNSVECLNDFYKKIEEATELGVIYMEEAIESIKKIKFDKDHLKNYGDDHKANPWSINHSRIFDSSVVSIIGSMIGKDAKIPNDFSGIEANKKQLLQMYQNGAVNVPTQYAKIEQNLAKLKTLMSSVKEAEGSWSEYFNEWSGVNSLGLRDTKVLKEVMRITGANERDAARILTSTFNSYNVTLKNDLRGVNNGIYELANLLARTSAGFKTSLAWYRLDRIWTKMQADNHRLLKKHAGK